MKTYFLTDAGKVRSHNEDNVVILKNKSGEVLMAVADGMGGHKAGEIASSIAVDFLATTFKDLNTIGTKENAIIYLRDSINEINQKIFSYTENHSESKGMGTTLVVSIITKEFVLFGNIGDSSGYVIKDNRLHKVTYDHTLVNLLVKSGELTEEEAKFHPRKNVLMKALGANNPAEMDIFDVDNTISSILLCSDGLTNMLTDDQIEKILNNQELSLEDKILKLVRKSNSRGGTDNISIAYLVRESGEVN